MDLSSLIVLGNALILGVRHGVDWDHIAAIADIVGTATATASDGSAISTVRQKTALGLSSCYAIGHATIVLFLGMAALIFSAVLPRWIDPLMERAVGITLLALSAWIFYSLMRQPATEGVVMQSRVMFILSKVQEASCRLYGRFSGNPRPARTTANQYSAPAAFGIGVIHGFGAETGTQLLLIATVGGSPNHFLGSLIILAFISGLLVSNTLVALFTCAGFTTSAKFRPLFITTSIVTGLFSLTVGTLLASGHAQVLPDFKL